jgi:hypothetical protein
MRPDALRKHALSLPGAHEEPHFVRTSFRIGKKIFATMTEDGAEAMVRVRPPHRLEALLASMPDVFFDHGAWTWKGGALGVRLAEVDPGLMCELVTDAWQELAPEGGAAGTSRARPPEPRASKPRSSHGGSSARKPRKKTERKRPRPPV